MQILLEGNCCLISVGIALKGMDIPSWSFEETLLCYVNQTFG